MASWSGGGSNVQAASLDDGRGCSVVGWGGSSANVFCFDSASGQAADAKFELLISDAEDEIPGLAYLWANQPAVRDYGPPPGYSFVGASRAGSRRTRIRNQVLPSLHAAAIAVAVQTGTKEVWNPRVTREDPGFYRARFKGFDAAGSPHVRVSAYGAGNNRRCRAQWVGEFVEVRCDNTAGQPADSLFSLVVFGD